VQIIYDLFIPLFTYFLQSDLQIFEIEDDIRYSKGWTRQEGHMFRTIFTNLSSGRNKKFAIRHCYFVSTLKGILKLVLAYIFSTRERSSLVRHVVQIIYDLFIPLFTYFLQSDLQIFEIEDDINTKTFLVIPVLCSYKSFSADHFNNKSKKK
jgi:hypothetical protein